MKREEPAASLIHTFGYEVGGEKLSGIESVLILKRIVDLSIGH